jgi:hypothetical protein
MGKHVLSKVESNVVESLTLGLVNRHCERELNRKLAPVQFDFVIELVVCGRERDPGDKGCLSCMITCEQPNVKNSVGDM